MGGCQLGAGRLLLLAYFLVVFVQGSIGGCPALPADGTQITAGGVTFAVYFNNDLDYDDAKDACLAEGYQPLALTSEAVDTAFLESAGVDGGSNCGSDRHVFATENSDGVWEWSYDGSLVSSHSYSNLKAGSSSPSNNNECLKQRTAGDGWQKDGCGDSRPYACYVSCAYTAKTDVTDSVASCLSAAKSDSGTVTTLAGTGGDQYNDGNGALAQFKKPTGIAVSADGTTVYVADKDNHVIRAV
eukprot:CAMPEP_0172078826 /NCGR_PEP_ID=MMETSP1043-20130122/17836_1 /TAXON_ID=464988 /ORGANISM="Hemiselmis andersenii, Strain CCMP441" /LENGTH=242 /DNA_ID=CAMNT_0012739947 /DNA_START=386 /DNA_END=1111 /DNA_ORIENTATION=-